MKTRSIVGIIATLFLSSMLNTSPVVALTFGTITDLGTINDIISPVYVSNIWTVTTGLDGRIYGGTSDGYAESQLFYYDKDLGWQVLGPPGIEVYTLATGNDGLIYGGSYMVNPEWHQPSHNAHFLLYDPTRPWNPGTMPEDNPYDMGPWSRLAGVPDAGVPGWAIIYDLTTGKDGKIYGGSGYGIDVGRDYAHLFVYDPATGTVTSLAQMLDQQGIIRLTTGLDGRIYFGVFPMGHLFIYDPATGQINDLGRPVEGDCVGSLTVALDGKIYGGTRQYGHVFSYDSDTETLVDEGNIPGSQNIWTLTTGTDGLIYGGEGPHGYFFVYDPTRAWNPGTEPWNNPCNLGRALPEESRIRSLATSADGLIYGSTALHAHLFVYTPPIPATIDVNPDVVKLASGAKFISGYIELPSGLSAYDIDPSTVKLDCIPALPSPPPTVDDTIPKPTGNGILDLGVKFDMPTVKDHIVDDLLGGTPPGPSETVYVMLTITGNLFSGESFRGSYTIAVKACPKG